MNTCLKKVNECLTKDWNIVEDMAQEMLKKEELTFNEVEEIFKKYGKSKIVSAKEYVSIKEKNSEETKNEIEVKKEEPKKETETKKEKTDK
jgi:hypothetical protein